MAGFSCAAQRRYRIGEPQNLCGIPADMVLGEDSLILIEDSVRCAVGDRYLGKATQPWMYSSALLLRGRVEDGY